MSRFFRGFIPERIPWFGVRLYDRIAAEAVSGFYREVALEITTFMDRGYFLDIGSGPGFLPLALAGLAPELKIVGVDLSRRMVRLARQRALKARLADRVRFEVGDGNRLAFADNTFDLVLSTGAFHSWRDPVRVLDEIHRVLRPGGEAWVYDPARIDTPQGRRILEEANGLDRWVVRWTSWANQSSRDRSEAEVREIMARSRFGGGALESGAYNRLRLSKPAAPP
ncbi:MAG: class I SAM-dependent methyltransferase [Thermodesulfobacteriota bacterium]